MNYLTESDIKEISNNVRLLSIDEIDDISHYSFDSHIAEYNDFLKIADKFCDLNVSKTFLLLHNEINFLLAYMTLSADSIKLTNVEKDIHGMSKVPYASIPALKVGKLAVNKELPEQLKRKGYGSFMLEIARLFVVNMNDLGIACRFITVDADIEYEANTPKFYEKNGFIENLSNKSRNAKHTISMRKDVFGID